MKTFNLLFLLLLTAGCASTTRREPPPTAFEVEPEVIFYGNQYMIMPEHYMR